MSSEENKTLARRFVQEHNLADYLTTFDQLLAPSCTIHEYLPGLPESMDRQAYVHFIAQFRNAIPDIHNTIEDVIAEGDRVVVRWKGYGTHTGAELMGIPAGNKQVAANGIYIFRFAQGRIVEVWDNWDNLNVMQQLGTPPASAPAQE
jgi:steroid delta-isomerase-like uncharacterized protein